MLKYNMRGKVPWSQGYVEAREEVILKSISSTTWLQEGLPKGYGVGFDERVVEIPWVYHGIGAKKGLLWDVGSVFNQESFLKHEKLENRKIIISNLNPEVKNFNRLNVSYLYENAVETVLQDDIVSDIVCVSTLEHIGFNNERYSGLIYKKNNPEMYLEAINVFKRKLIRGGKLHLTVPFGKRADQNWFQVFDQKMINNIIEAFIPINAKTTIFFCGPDGWEISDSEKCRKCIFYDWRYPVEKNVKTAGSQAVACLTLQK